MYIAKNEGLIVLVRDTKEELEKDLDCMVYDTIEETETNYTLYNGKYLTDKELEETKKQEEEQKANTVTLETLKAQNEELKNMVTELLGYIKNGSIKEAENG